MADDVVAGNLPYVGSEDEIAAFFLFEPLLTPHFDQLILELFVPALLLLLKYDPALLQPSFSLEFHVLG